MAGRHSRSTRALSVLLGTFLTAVFTGVVPGLASAAGASSGPFTPSIQTTTSTTDVICRANGGSLSANTEADQSLGSTVSAPDAVMAGQSFDIKVKQPYSSFPSSDSSTGISATIVAIYNQISRWKLPTGLTISSVSLAPINGDVGANADAGYYIAPANIPAVDKQSNGEVIEGFDPLTLPASSRVAIPGTAPAALIDSATNTVRMGMVGTGTESSGTVYAGGSIVQAPAVTLHVTASSAVAAGSDLGIKMAGSLPAGTFTGSEPNNFPAPAAITVNQATLTSSDTVWTDPSYVNYVYTTALGGLIKITAKAACAPGYESNGDLGTTPPDYYTGPDAIPNGTAPLMNHTTVIGVGSTAPFEGASYLTGSTVNAAYSCIANPDGETYDTCVGDVPNGSPIDTATPGPHTFTISATDAFQDPITKTIHYTVADPQAPLANAGTAQTGKVAGAVVTLDGSGSSDPNGPPALPLTYT
ncbi:MAG TPA: hypothetical protein VH914_15600, partial [Acidimicrobiia bacterium]|nr:hypothetical protein [Acidimicrobiia bacterium]